VVDARQLLRQWCRNDNSKVLPWYFGSSRVSELGEEDGDVAQSG